MDYIASRIRQDRLQQDIQKLPQAFHTATSNLQPFVAADGLDAEPSRDYIDDDVSRFKPFLQDLRSVSSKLRDASSGIALPKAYKLDQKLKQQCESIVTETVELLRPLKDLSKENDAADTRMRVIKSVAKQVEEIGSEVEQRIAQREAVERIVIEAEDETRDSPANSLAPPQQEPRRPISIGSSDSGSATSVHTPVRRIARPGRSPTHPYGIAQGSQGIGATPRLRFVTQLSSFQNPAL